MVSAAHTSTPAPLTGPNAPSGAQPLKLVEPARSVASSLAARRLRTVLTFLHAAVGVAALVGGAMLISEPTGSRVGLTQNQLHAFTDFFIPGIVLLMLGLMQTITAFYTRRPGAAPMTASHWAGALLVLFVAVQSALVVPIVPFAVALGLVGVFIYSVADELHRGEPHTPLLP